MTSVLRTMQYKTEYGAVIMSDALRQFMQFMSRTAHMWPPFFARDLIVSLDPLKCTFLADYISAHRGCCVPKILHALDIDQALIAHTRSGTGVPPPKKKILIVKI